MKAAAVSQNATTPIIPKEKKRKAASVDGMAVRVIQRNSDDGFFDREISLKCRISTCCQKTAIGAATITSIFVLIVGASVMLLFPNRYTSLLFS
jgi:hypothetical protein